MSRSIAVGFIGKMGAGKSTAGKVLDLHGFVRLHPFTTGRLMLKPFLAAIGIPEAEHDDWLEGSRKRDIIPILGRTPQELQQSLGTEWGRKCVSPDIWNLIGQIRADGLRRFYNDSIRFENEAQVIRDRGGLLIRIEGIPAPGQGDLGLHSSETEQDHIKADVTIPNNGSIMQLHANVLTAVLDRFEAELAA